MSHPNGTLGGVKRLYLDMWAWIALTDARKSADPLNPWSEVYDLAEAAVALGAVSLPLSSAHYMEVAKAPKWRRLELASTMAALSRWHAMIGPIPALVQSEISAALDKRFGPGPVIRTSLQIFGRGYGHVFRVSANDDFVRVYQAVGPELEFHLLAQTVLSEAEERSMREHLDHWSGKFVTDEQRFATVTSEEGISGARLDDVARGVEFIELLDYLDPALEERGLVNGALIKRGREKASLIEFLRDVPTAWNQAEMKRVQHADRRRRWEDNDHYDINSYSVALTYCDALVAERHWADKVRRADLQTVNECKFMTAVEELRLYLAGV